MNIRPSGVRYYLNGGALYLNGRVKNNELNCFGVIKNKLKCLLNCIKFRLTKKTVEDV